MSEKNEVLTYKGHPLMRKDNLVYYGSMADEFIVMLQILETKKLDDLELATKVSVQLQRTDPAAKARDRVVKKTEKDGFYTALDVGCVWLERALNAKYAQFLFGRYFYMKRMIKVLLILAATVAAVAALAITAGATELKTGIGIVEANGGLRLRSQASTSSDVLSTAHNGDNVVVIRQVGNWYLVNYNLKIGYMHSDYITFKERENIELGYGSVDPYLANIRSGPSTSSGLVDQAGSGAKVFIFGFNCGWYKVKYNGQIGYIRSDLVTLLEKPYCNSGSSSSGSSYSSATGYDNSYSSGSSSSSSTSLGQQIAVFGMQYVGYPYVYGGTSPSGFDCSGFVQYIYRQFGYSINRTATAQLANGYYVSYDSLMPGDLVFFGSGSSASHVGMYIGGGEFVHAANSRSGVKISSLSESWYAARYIGARRIVG